MPMSLLKTASKVNGVLPSCSPGTFSKLPVSISVLRMVPVPVRLSMSAPSESNSEHSNVSPLSGTLSSMIGTEMILLVSPGRNVRVPFTCLVVLSPIAVTLKSVEYVDGYGPARFPVQRDDEVRRHVGALGRRGVADRDQHLGVGGALDTHP